MRTRTRVVEGRHFPWTFRIERHALHPLQYFLTYFLFRGPVELRLSTSFVTNVIRSGIGSPYLSLRSIVYGLTSKDDPRWVPVWMYVPYTTECDLYKESETTSKLSESL